MKLRIFGNSVRLRLGRSEVRQLAEAGAVGQSTWFGPTQCLTYEIEAAADARGTSASFEDGRLLVRVPRDVVVRWASTDQIGITTEQSIKDDTGTSLSILIEKDFECVDAPPSEPQDDAYPNPQRCREVEAE